MAGDLRKFLAELWQSWSVAKSESPTLAIDLFPITPSLSSKSFTSPLLIMISGLFLALWKDQACLAQNSVVYARRLGLLS